MRAFTLSPENSEALDTLLTTPLHAPEMQFILREIYPADTPAVVMNQLDDGHLTSSDYEALYAAFTTQKKDPKAWNNFAGSERLPEYTRLCSLMHREPNRAELMLELKRRQAVNRRTRGKRARPITVNASRIVDALLAIALRELRRTTSPENQERVASLDVKGRSRKDVGQGRHKLSVPRRSKEAAV